MPCQVIPQRMLSPGGIKRDPMRRTSDGTCEQQHLFMPRSVVMTTRNFIQMIRNLPHSLSELQHLFMPRSHWPVASRSHWPPGQFGTLQFCDLLWYTQPVYCTLRPVKVHAAPCAIPELVAAWQFRRCARVPGGAAEVQGRAVRQPSQRGGAAGVNGR